MKFVISKINFPIYAFFILLSIIIGFVLVYRLLRKENAKREYILFCFVLCLVLLFLGAKYYTIITSFGKVNLLNAGLSSLGAAIGITIGLFIMQKIIPEVNFSKPFIINLPLIYSISKIGCFFAGCCHGIKYNGIFNVVYNNGIGPSYNVLPVQLIETIVFFILFIICYRLYKNKYVVEITLILCSIFKFLLDYLRESHMSVILSANQIVCIIIFIISLIILIKRLTKKS